MKHLCRTKCAKFFGSEKSVRQCYLIHSPQIRILGEVWIDIEKYRHVHLLVWIQPLLFEAETLNFAEILSSLHTGK